MNTGFHFVTSKVRPASVMESGNDVPSLARESVSLRNNVKELELERTRLEERLREARSASQAKDKYMPTFSDL
jgi:predicted RNase H-like nuclease (RuvC/YqgF family)